MATYVPAKRATEYIFYVGLDSVATAGAFQANPTLASGDFKVSKDGGSLSDLTTLPSVAPASSKMVKITLSTTEMDADNVTVVCSDASGGEWKDLIVNIQTAARQIDDLAYGTVNANVTQISGDATAADNAESFFDGTGYAGTNNVIPTVTAVTNGVGLADGAITAAKIAADAITAAKIADGAIDAATFAAGAINAAAIATDAIDADAIAADAVTELQSGLATASALATVDTVVDAILVDTAEIGTAGAGLTAVASAANLATLAGYVDTEVAAIKAKTDNLPASPAATGDIPAASSIAAAVWAYVVEGALTAVQVYRIIVSVLAGKSTGGGTTSVAFRDIADSKNRVSATVDADGNRNAVTLDGS